MKNYSKVTQKILKELHLDKNVLTVKAKENKVNIPIYQFKITVVFKDETDNFNILLNSYGRYGFLKNDYSLYIKNYIIKNRELFV